jgi:hypothetical protein
MPALRLGGFRRWVAETHAYVAGCQEKDAIQSDYTDIAQDREDGGRGDTSDIRCAEDLAQKDPAR